MSNHQCTAVTYGIDLGKTWFHVVGLDHTGNPIKRAKLNRASIIRFFINIPASTRRHGGMSGLSVAGR
ncbi:hypothetical protein [Delftia acidovorans]|uniref:IS110 family transposase n=1 Tax=Delftia acidovorans TaxID=80866 RepID=A0AAJ2R2N2_DELAC|nr:hypothetical protein [Delftia acidovorans]MDX4954733.1 hypothetical protein [Delftia acidovorans]